VQLVRVGDLRVEFGAELLEASNPLGVVFHRTFPGTWQRPAAVTSDGADYLAQNPRDASTAVAIFAIAIEIDISFWFWLKNQNDRRN
jgi:hypothetical protein